MALPLQDAFIHQAAPVDLLGSGEELEALLDSGPSNITPRSQITVITYFHLLVGKMIKKTLRLCIWGKGYWWEPGVPTLQHSASVSSPVKSCQP